MSSLIDASGLPEGKVDEIAAATSPCRIVLTRRRETRRKALQEALAVLTEFAVANRGVNGMDRQPRHIVLAFITGRPPDEPLASDVVLEPNDPTLRVRAFKFARR